MALDRGWGRLCLVVLFLMGRRCLGGSLGRLSCMQVRVVVEVLGQEEEKEE